ncbi:DUF3272 family protein [Streptococcus hongkongensis]|nr:membrane protein [Streptococcus uberis]
MTIRQFIFMALLCAFETYFFNDSILSGDYFFALFWGFLLYRDLRKVHAITNFSKKLIEATKHAKKKD